MSEELENAVPEGAPTSVNENETASEISGQAVNAEAGSDAGGKTPEGVYTPPCINNILGKGFHSEHRFESVVAAGAFLKSQKNDLAAALEVLSEINLKSDRPMGAKDLELMAQAAFQEPFQFPCRNIVIRQALCVEAECNVNKNSVQITRCGKIYRTKVGGILYEFENVVIDAKGISGYLKAIGITGKTLNADYLCLSSEQKRTNFARKCKIGDGWQKIAEDLLQIEEELKIYCQLHPPSKPAKQQGCQMSEVDKEEALQMLKDPQLVARIISDIEMQGYCGEDSLKLLIYLCATSRLLGAHEHSNAKPLVILIKGESGSGKSFALTVILRMMPKESVVDLSSLSEKALLYLPGDFLKNKFIIVTEYVGQQAAEYYIRTLVSEGKLSHGVTLQDPETGEFYTQFVEVQGPVSFASTTTMEHINIENETRLLELRADDSERQTVLIHKRQKHDRTLEAQKSSAECARILRCHQNAQRLLKPVEVIIPYAPLLEFAAQTHSPRVRRDLPKLLDLISVIGLLHQHQREVKTLADGTTYVEATAGDYRAAYQIAREIFRSALDDLSPQARVLLDTIIECKHYSTFTRKDIREWTGWADSSVRKHIKGLEDGGYLEIHTIGGGGKSVTYTGNVDARDPVKLGLISPEELEERIKASDQNNE